MSIQYTKVPTSENGVADGSKRFWQDLLGFEVLQSLHQDAKMLILAKVVRMFSFGFLSVMLVVYLQCLNFADKDIGILFSLTLMGDMVISLVMTSHADVWGRRKILLVGSFLSIITGIIFATQQNFWILLISAVLGVISPSGNEVGPFMAIELSGLAQVSRDNDRTKLMAWYNLFSCFASAFGALFCGFFISFLQFQFKYSKLNSYKVVMIIYSLIQLLKFYIVYNLTADIEISKTSSNIIKKKENNPITLFLGLHKSKMIVLQLSVLFMMDSFAGSFILQSLICAWFNNVYETSTTKLGSMIFICNIVAGISALFAAKLAEIIGLIATMAATHLPSNIMIILVPLMPTEFLAIIMLCFRYCISQMDVPTRNAYVQGVVDADERSAANGITNVVRSLGASLGPSIATILYANSHTRNYPFYIAGSIKIVYDILLLISFSSIPTKEEKEEALNRSAHSKTEEPPL